MVGDGKTYGAYHNKPLPNEPVQIAEGVVSNFGGERRVAYSPILPEMIDYGTSGSVDAILKGAIVVCAFLLIGLAVAFYLLRRHFSKKRRLQMSSFPHELSVHGPMIEVVSISAF